MSRGRAAVTRHLASATARNRRRGTDQPTPKAAGDERAKRLRAAYQRKINDNRKDT